MANVSNFPPILANFWDFPVKIRPEKEVWWIYSFEQEWNIFILHILRYLFQKVMCPAWAIFFVFWLFRGIVLRELWDFWQIILPLFGGKWILSFFAEAVGESCRYCGRLRGALEGFCRFRDTTPAWVAGIFDSSH